MAGESGSNSSWFPGGFKRVFWMAIPAICLSRAAFSAGSPLSAASASGQLAVPATEPPPAEVAPEKPRKCQSFSLADPGGSMEHVPILDQGDLGSCYAYAASEAVDAWRFSRTPPDDTGFHTSPHATAISGKFNVSPYDRANQIMGDIGNPGNSALESSDTAETIRALKKDGICSYDAFGAGFKNTMYAEDPKTFWKQVQDAYDFYHQAYMNALLARDQARQDGILAKASAKFTSLFCEGGFNDTQSGFGKMNEMLGMIVADSVYGTLKEISAKVCAGHIRALPRDFPEKPATFGMNQITPSSLLEIKSRSKIYSHVMDAMFDFKNKQPVMIGYCDEVLTKPANDSLVDPEKPVDCSVHASLIIGRGTMTDGRCGFLIRNSWGTDRDSQHGLPSNIDANGDVWVAEDDLYRNLFDMSVIPPQGEAYKPPKNAYEGLAK